MGSKKLELKSPDDAETVYYEAFRHCDSKVMAAMWADGDVICVHPGSGAVIGHGAVVRSWRHILTNAQTPEIEVTVLKRMDVDGLAVHLVIERLTDRNNTSVSVLATNVYQKFDSGWLIVQHHASLVESQEATGHTLQ